MKKHMLPETARMFTQCVHRVVVRDSAFGPDTLDWLTNNIAKTEAGFRPWIRMGREFKFMHERDAVMFALKWA
jgi:hypothetical protein